MVALVIILICSLKNEQWWMRFGLLSGSPSAGERLPGHHRREHLESGARPRGQLSQPWSRVLRQDSHASRVPSQFGVSMHAAAQLPT